MQNLDYVMIGRRIKSSRRDAGMTQEQLAEECKCTSRYLSSIENGKKKPSLELLTRISTVLDVSVDGFLFDSPLSYSGYLVNRVISEKINLLDKAHLLYLEKTINNLLELQEAYSNTMKK